MRRDPKDAAHLISVGVVFIVGLAAFLMLRAAVVPAGFGRYGHFRAGSLEENRSRPVQYAGQTACSACHDDVVAARGRGKHRIVSCEGCHLPQSRHAEDPYSGKPPKVGTPALCASCHRADAAKPAGFPQVVPEEHSGGEACASCHNPHQPKL